MSLSVRMRKSKINSISKKDFRDFIESEIEWFERKLKLFDNNHESLDISDYNFPTSSEIDGFMNRMIKANFFKSKSEIIRFFLNNYILIKNEVD